MTGEMERLETVFSAQQLPGSQKNVSGVNRSNTGTSSCQSSFSGNADSKAAVRQFSAMDLERTPLDYHDDVISCISEGNGANMIDGDNKGEADGKTVSCGSVNSSFTAMDVQSANLFPSSEKRMVKEGEICSAMPLTCSREVQQLADKLPDRSDPSETSSYRSKCEEARSLEQDIDSLPRPVDCVNDGENYDSHMSAHSLEIGSEKDDGNHLTADAVKSPGHTEQPEFKEALDVCSKVEPCVLSRAMDDNDGSEELVDVRVCDICGDVGREASLAVCSRCGDGAEHIYCMRIKLDKPPEGDWLCEECATSKQQMQSGAVVGKSAGSTKLSPSYEKNLGAEDTGGRKQSSIKRPGSALESLTGKRSFLHRSLSSIMTKRELQETAAVKKLNKGECSPLPTQVSEHPNEEGRIASHLTKNSPPVGRQADGPGPSLKRSYSSITGTTMPTSPRSGPGISRFEGKKRTGLLGNAKFKLDRMPKEIGYEKKTAGSKNRNGANSAGCIDRKASNSAGGATRQLLPSPRRGSLPVGTVSSSNRLKAKQSCEDSNRELACRASGSHLKNADKATSLPVKATPSSEVVPLFTFPEPDHIWRGVFKFERGGKLPTHWDGIQAHLSSSASPKVPEVALKFPLELHLLEVPRSDAWPIQFQKNGASEEDIALYFFAENRQSYHRTYQGLLEHMIANDVALVADLNGVELLIFPSSVLPRRSQRWNNLSYLWGVFRGTKPRSPCCLPVSGSDKKDFMPNFTVDATAEDFPVSPKREVISASTGGSVSSSHALHLPIKVRGWHCDSPITHASAGNEPDVSQAQKHLISQNVGGSISTDTDTSLPGNLVKGLQFLEIMEPSEDLQKDDGCGMRSHSDEKHVDNTGLFLLAEVGECCQNGNLSTQTFRSQSGRVSDDLQGTSDPMIDSSSNKRTDVAHESMISFIPLVSDPSPHPDSIAWYHFSCQGQQTDPTDTYPDLELSLGSMAKSMNRANLASFLVPLNGDDFYPQVDVNLSLASPTISRKVMPEFIPNTGLLLPGKRLV